MANVLLYSQNRISAMGFRHVLESEQGFHINNVYKLDDTLEVARLTRPDLLIYDIDNTVELSPLRNLNHLVPHCRVILWVGAISPELALQATNLGIAAIIPKTAEPQEFLRSIQKVQDGGTCLDRSFTAGVSLPKRVSLSKRETELVALIAQGLRNKEIAARLSITENTVKAYLSRLFEKVKVDDRLGLALYGLTNTTADLQALRNKVGTRTPLDIPKASMFKPHTGSLSEQFVPVHP